MRFSWEAGSRSRGATFQALLRNPLAEPYILGISGGASVGAVLVLAIGWVAAGSVGTPARRFRGRPRGHRLGLPRCGRQLADPWTCGSCCSRAWWSRHSSRPASRSSSRCRRHVRLQSAVLWIMGSLAAGSWTSVTLTAAYTLPATLLLIGLARPLNLLAIGEETAHYLGLPMWRA